MTLIGAAIAAKCARALQHARNGQPYMLVLTSAQANAAVALLGRNATTVYGPDPLGRLPAAPSECYVIIALPGDFEVLRQRLKNQPHRGHRVCLGS